MTDNAPKNHVSRDAVSDDASDDVLDIREYYNAGVDGEDFRLDRHQLERDLTWRYFETYLPAQGNSLIQKRVLEIGAATGAHTLWLASRGYRVLAIDFAPNQLERCQQKLKQAGLELYASCRIDDARDLKNVPESDFDAVLLMGPLYHLVMIDDRKMALAAAVSRLKKGGIFFSSHISRFGILGDLIRNIPDWIEKQDEVRSVIELGRDPFHRRGEGFRGYFATSEEIIQLHEDAGLETLALAGIEPAISADDESYNRLYDRQRALWLDLLFEVSQEPGILAASRHLLYIGRKV